jgi:hypothetical protein
MNSHRVARVSKMFDVTVGVWRGVHIAVLVISLAACGGGCSSGSSSSAPTPTYTVGQAPVCWSSSPTASRRHRPAQNYQKVKRTPITGAMLSSW